LTLEALQVRSRKPPKSRCVNESGCAESTTRFCVCSSGVGAALLWKIGAEVAFLLRGAERGLEQQRERRAFLSPRKVSLPLPCLSAVKIPIPSLGILPRSGKSSDRSKIPGSGCCSGLLKALALGWAARSPLLDAATAGVFTGSASPDEPGPTHRLCFASPAPARHWGRLLPALLCRWYRVGNVSCESQRCSSAGTSKGRMGRTEETPQRAPG